MVAQVTSQEQLIDGESYAASQARYAEKVARKEARSNQLVLSGFNVNMRVGRGALVIKAVVLQKI